MNITICGGGNIGTQLAVHCAEKENKVIIHTSKPEKFNNMLTIVDENEKVLHKGKIYKATSDDKEAFENVDLIFVTLPAFMMNEISNKIVKFAKPQMKICLVPGTGGGECAFYNCLKKGATIFGLQRVPSVARLVEYGKKVCATGYRNELFTASLPNDKAEECRKIIEKILNIKTSIMPNYLNLTLTPSNPILHTTRLKVIFKDYFEGKLYDKLPLFYEDWNDETSELLFKCDDEVQEICNKLKEFDLSYVKSLKIHYESDTPEKLTQKIRSIKGFKGLRTPCIEIKNKFAPDFNSRYFTADFNYGLTILIQISNMIKSSNQNMLNVLNWYEKFKKYKKEFNYRDYGINNLNEFKNFYLK